MAGVITFEMVNSGALMVVTGAPEAAPSALTMVISTLEAAPGTVVMTGRLVAILFF